MDNYNYEDIRDAFDLLGELNIVARQHGLLGLEETVAELISEETGEPADTCDEYFYRAVSGIDRFLVLLIMLVVDGTDPEIIRDIAEARCRSAKFEGTDALLADMIVTAVLAIQAGENPRIMRLKLLSLLPEELEDKIIANEIAKRGQEDGEGQEGMEKQEADSSVDSLLTDDDIFALLTPGEQGSGEES